MDNKRVIDSVVLTPEDATSWNDKMKRNVLKKFKEELE